MTNKTTFVSELNDHGLGDIFELWITYASKDQGLQCEICNMNYNAICNPYDTIKYHKYEIVIPGYGSGCICTECYKNYFELIRAGHDGYVKLINKPHNNILTKVAIHK